MFVAVKLSEVSVHAVEEARERDECWLDDKIYEADLCLSDIGSVAVTEHGRLEAKRFLAVALVKKFNEEQLNPLVIDRQGLGRVAHIANVHDKTHCIFYVAFLREVELS